MIEQGTILDNTYRIIKPIGSGGGGEIYLAVHMRLETTVVIKKIKDHVKGLIANRGEADILKNLRHQYLPRVSNYFIENNQVYTVMEYIEGESFQQLLEAGKKFETKDVIKWGTQLSEVLAYLHSQTPPIIHRDIKPANIMLTPEGDIRLIDFNVSVGQEDNVGILAHSDGYSPWEQYGIMRSERQYYAKKNKEVATDETELTDAAMQNNGAEIYTELLPQSDAGMLCGDETAILQEEYGQTDETEFLIPSDEEREWSGAGSDIHTGNGASSMERNYETLPRVDERSDIYSLGATLYHLITQKRPERATGYVTPLSECYVHVGDGLLYIIEKAMQEDPEKRFQTAAKMHDAFVNIKKLDHEYVAYAFKRDILYGLVIAAVCCSTVCTILGYKKMKAEEYNTYVAQIETANEYSIQGRMQEAEEACAYAMEIRPDDLVAYVELVHIYYIWQKYDAGIAQVEQIVTDIGNPEGEAYVEWATLQFLAGECCMELEKFGEAADYYKQAIAFRPSEGEYYTRCAIALARAGEQEEADAFLEDAMQKGISDASFYLTKAEIMLSQKKYEESETLVYKVLEMTQDNDLRYHAYLTAARIYEDGADIIDDAMEKERALLEMAVEHLESGYALSLSEKLGDIYYELAGQEKNEKQAVAYYENALDCFNELYQKGYQNFHVMQNMAVINQTLENYEEAEAVLLDMINIYPEDYRGYMYLTLLYTEIQNNISIEKRDYSAIFEYYDKAEILYQREISNGEDMDVNMQILESMMKDIRKLTD